MSTATDHKALREAAAARDAGIETTENAADPRITLAINARIEAAIEDGKPFSANTIRADFPVSAASLVGARFNAYCQKRVDGHPLMVCVGRTPSTLASTHHHEIKVWQGWDAHQAALAADHA